MRFDFEGLVIDTERLVVERDGAPVPVQPQVFDVLAVLLLRRDRVVTKEELLDDVWGDRFVSESALTSRIKSARQLVGDDGIAQRAIKTFHGRGYRWVGPVSVERTATSVATEEVPALEPPPRRLTPLIGRDDDLDVVAALLADRPLVTLIGPPGVGKSALATEVAGRARLEGTPVAFAELGSCDDPSTVVGELRRSAGVQRRSPDEREPPHDDPVAIAAVADRLRAGPAVLVLDDCDRVAGDVAALVGRLLDACPQLVVLATARRALGLPGEHVSQVRPLPLPRRDASWVDLLASPAGRLFVERSGAAGATWTERDEEAQAIASICRSVDGLPLAIELSAARSRWLSLDDLLREHDDLVGASGAERRRDPLTTAITSSRSLLTPEQRLAFDALSVFTGSFRIDAGLAVLDAVQPQVHPLDLFEALVESSLVDVVLGRRQRYRLLGPVRAHAESCRRDSPVDETAIAAHFEHYLRFVRRRWPIGRIATVHPWTALADERHEIDVAVRRCLDAGRPNDARRLLGALGWYWWTGGEVHLWDRLATEAEAGSEDDPDDVAAGFHFARTLGAHLLGRDPRPFASAASTSAVAVGEWSVAAWAIVFEIAPDMMWIDLAPVADRWDEIVGLFRRGDDLAGEAWATTIVLGYAQVCAGQHEAAVRSYEAAARMFDRCGDEVGVVRAMLETVEQHIWTGHDVPAARAAFDAIPETSATLPVETRAKRCWLGGLIAGAEGDHDAEVRLHLEALGICERDLPGALLTNTYRVMAACALRRAGRSAEAAESFGAAVAALDRLSDAPGTGRHRAWLLERAAGLLIETGRTELAAEVLGAVERLREQLPAPMPYWDRRDYQRDVAAAEQQLGRHELEARWRAGSERPIDDLVAQLIRRLEEIRSRPEAG